MRVRWIASASGSPRDCPSTCTSQGRAEAYLPAWTSWVPLRELSRTRLSLASARAAPILKSAVIAPTASRSERA